MNQAVTEEVRSDILKLKENLRQKDLAIPTAAEIDEKRVKQAIADLDLSKVIMKLTHPKYGLGWSMEDAKDAEGWYRMYLFLVAKYPDAYLVPTVKIDDFWHNHILDTRAYGPDCEKVFGKYHHHWPYAGMLGDEDYQTWMQNVILTELLFETEFGVSYILGGASCTCFGGKCK